MLDGLVGLEEVLLENEVVIPDFLAEEHDEHPDLLHGMYSPLIFDKSKVLDYVCSFNPKIDRNTCKFTGGELELFAAFYHGGGYMSVDEFNLFRDYRVSTGENILEDGIDSLKTRISRLNKKGLEITSNKAKAYNFANNMRDCRKDMIRVQTDESLPELGYNPYSLHTFVGNDDKKGVRFTTGELSLFSEIIHGKGLYRSLKDIETVHLARIRKKIRNHTKGQYTLGKTSSENGVKLIRI